MNPAKKEMYLFYSADDEEIKYKLASSCRVMEGFYEMIRLSQIEDWQLFT